MNKKIISVILAVCMAVSCFTVGAASASALDVSEITIPAYSSRADFINDFNLGKTIDEFNDGEDRIYKFTLDKASNIMIAGVAISGSISFSSIVGVYTDINCTNKVLTDKNEKYKAVIYGYLDAGTYYIKAKYFCTGCTSYVYAGQVSGSKIGVSLSYVKTNSNKTADLSFKLSDNAVAEHLYVKTSSYGESTYIPDEYIFDSKNNQFNVSYAQQPRACTNVKIVDKNGFMYYGFTRVLNKYTAKIEGSTTKVYTGKTVKLLTKDVTLKAGYDAIAYTASYKNNKKIGKATVTFKAKNGCIGSYTTSFNIVPDKVKKITAKDKSNSKNRNVKFSWLDSKGATKYVVQTKSGYNDTYKTAKTVKSKSCTLKVKKGTTYVQVYGIKKVNGKTYKSAGASLKVICIYSTYTHKYSIYIRK